MATLVTDAELNADATRASGAMSYLSIHSTTPGVTGAAEAAGGTPAYARKALSFPNAAGTAGPLGSTLQPATVGVIWSAQVIFDVPAGNYNYWGSWSALTAGTYRRGNVLAAPQIPGSQSQITVSIGVGPYTGA
jgi:hypothetical protein